MAVTPTLPVPSSACSGLLVLGGGLGLGLLPLLLLGRQGPQLEGVDAALAVHLVPEEGVDHAVAGGLHLGLEGVGDDDESGVVRLMLAGVLHGSLTRVCLGKGGGGAWESAGGRGGVMDGML